NAVASPDRASTAPTAAPTWREPRRVFVPIDAERRPVGPYYWVPSDFYEEIRSTLAARPSERSWRVVDALYEGVVNHNAFADATSLFNLTATYSVVLDEPNATIAFPATRLAPDFDVKFDDRAIAPTFAENGREIFFEIVDAEPGEHRLELTIAPPQFSETNAEISFPIPPVPSARLELTVPPDAPTFDFPNALGKTTRSPGRVVVELGAIDRLVVAKTASNVPSGKTSVDVEQLFLMRARPTQADVRASFRCQVVGGKVSSLVLVGDPLYSFSGYCQCDKTEIESVETLADGSSRVAFKTPISGAFALDADFVARNFSGVGRARLPSLAVRDARVLKSWLALVPGGDVECANIPPATETIAAFQHAWGAPLKETPIAVYNLDKTPRGASISTRLKSVRPSASETTTLVFRPTQVETRLVATLDAPTELFRLDLETPTPFAVDEIALFDEQNVAVETPEFFLDPGALSLLFRAPLKGRYSLRIVGRATTTLDAARPFPTLALQNVDRAESRVRLYRAANAYLDWTEPAAWTPLDATRLAAVETLDPAPTDDVCLVGAFDAVAPDAQSNAESSSRPTPIRPSDVVVRVNAPRLEGVQRVFLYRKTGESWKTAVDFRVDVQNGRVDRFCVAADDAYSLEPLDPASNFVATETTLETGERAYLFQPKKTPFVGPAEFVFVATMKNKNENVRLPRFRLLPASAREDVSGVRRFAFLPQRFNATPIRWETENLRPVSPENYPSTTLGDATRELTRGTAALVAGGASSDSPTFLVPPAILTIESGMSNVDAVDFSILETQNDDADAWLASENDRLQISRARSSFYVDADGEIFVSSTFSLRPNAPLECGLLVPESARVLEATVNGSRRRVENLGGGRWLLDLDATRVGKRLEVAVQFPASRTPRVERSLFGGATTCELVVPRLEGAAPDETSWFCAFESFDGAASRWRVQQVDVAEPGVDAPERPETRLAPVRYSAANELLFRLCVDDANALLVELERDAALFANARADEFERRRVRWARAWRRNEREIARFVAPDRPVDALSSAQRDAFLAVRADAPLDASDSSPLENWSNARYREIIEQKAKLEGTYRFPSVAEDAPNVAPEILWAVDQTLNARVLAGWTDARLDRIVVVAPSERFNFFASRFASALFVLAATAVALRLLRSSLKSPRFQRVLFVFLVGCAASAFFVLDWRALGLAFVLLLALLPPLLDATRRGDALDRQADENAKPNPPNAPNDGETTESLCVARRPDAVAPPPVRDANVDR
ncbi:MAG: hypothetical protein IKW13_04410, partial [Thermoguttaceae bacterium]|nr:hypothetical protein [Thermoguttaceae bacterium]